MENATAARRQLGRHLRDARGRSGLSATDARAALEWSHATMWRVETGKTTVRTADVQAMCRLYGLASAEEEELVQLARQAREKVWWDGGGDSVSERYNVFRSLEETASEVHVYDSELVPGLLQTPEYTRNVVALGSPELGTDEIEHRVRLRQERQALLSRPVRTPSFVFVLNETVLRRPLGSRSMMAEQFTRLLEADERRNVAVHVLPFSARPQPGILSGPFILLRFPRTSDGRDTEPPLAYVEGLTRALYLETPAETGRYEQVFNAILAEAADRIGHDSRALLGAARKEMGG